MRLITLALMPLNYGRDFPGEARKVLFLAFPEGDENFFSRKEGNDKILNMQIDE